MPINFTVQTQGRNKGKRAPNPHGKVQPAAQRMGCQPAPMHNPALPQPGGPPAAPGLCWTCQRQDTHAERSEDDY